MDDRQATLSALKEWLANDGAAAEIVRRLVENPEVDGAELVRHVRAAPAAGAPPGIVALVDKGRVDRLVQIARADAINVFLDRPPDMRAWRDRLEALLAIPLQPDGVLPKVADVAIYDVGVSRSKYAAKGRTAPYLRRHADDELDEALASSSFVLIVGSSKAGKSRTAIEAVRRAKADWRLVVPVGDLTAPARLATLLAPLNAEPAVLWLDDLDRYLGPNGLDLKVLKQLADRDPAVTVVATIRSKRRQDLLAADGEVGRGARMVLESARIVTLPRLLLEDERVAAKKLYPKEKFDDRGIGEQLVAAPLLEQRYDDAYDSNPLGWAIVQAAIDWRRVGLEKDISEPLLHDLARLYLEDNGADVVATDSAWAAALAWARKPVAGGVALVQSVNGGGADPGYRAFDYILAYADGQRETDPVPILSSAWQFAIERVEGDDLLSVSFEGMARREFAAARRAAQRARTSAAHGGSTWAMATLIVGELELEEGRLDVAVALLEEAAGSKVGDVVPLAQIDLSVIRLRAGDAAGARALIDAAMQAGDVVPHALADVNLAAVLDLQGDGQGARRLLERALESDNSEIAALARASLGSMLVRQGDIARGRELLEKALEEESRRTLPLVQLSLGSLLVKEGERARGRELLRAAASSSDWQHAPRAADLLGDVLKQDGDDAGAEAAYQIAVDAGHPTWTPMAQIDLALLVRKRDDARARELLAAAAAAAVDPALRARAADLLGDLLARQGDEVGAEAAYRIAIDSGHIYWRATAQIDLAQLISDRDPEEAKQLLAAAAASGHAEVGPRAALLLGDLLAEREDETAAAAIAYQSAIASGHARWAPAAKLALAAQLAERDPTRAIELLRTVPPSATADTLARAGHLLGGLLAASGDAPGAKAAYQAAIDHGDSTWRARAQIALSDVIAAEGDLPAAEALLVSAAGSDDAQLSALAQAVRGGLLINYGQPERARASLEAALSSGAADAVAVAQANLGALLVSVGEPERARELLELASVSAHSDARALAQLNLSLLLGGTDPERARKLLDSAIASGNRAVAAVARANLGSMLAKAGDIKAAGELLDAALASKNGTAVAIAQLNLGVLAIGDDDRRRGRELLEAAAKATHANVAMTAQVLLGRMLAEDGELARARALLEPVMASGYPEQGPLAADALGDALAEAGDAAGAEAAYRAAIASGHPTWAPTAQIDLAVLLGKRGDAAGAEALLRAAAESSDPELAARAREQAAALSLSAPPPPTPLSGDRRGRARGRARAPRRSRRAPRPP